MANRTVTVGLALEVTRYRRGAAEAIAETKAIKREVEGLNREADVTSTRFKKATDEVANFGRNTTRQIGETKGRFAKAGTEAGMSMGQAMSGGILKMFVALPPQMKAVIIGAAAAAAPVLGATLAAGVAAGLGSGGVIAGVLLAARDPRIQAAGKELGQNLLGQLQSAAGPFIQPVLNAIGILRQASLDVGADIQRMFAAAARFVEPLANGIAGMIRNIMPALASGMERIKPVMDVLAAGLPRIGAAIAGFLDSITTNADDAAGGMELLIQIIEKTIRGAGEFIGTLTQVFSTFVDVALGIAKATDAIMPDWHPMHDQLAGSITDLEAMKAAIAGTGEGAAGAAGGMNSLAGATNSAGQAAQGTAAAYVSLAQRMRESAEANSSYISGMISMEQAIDDVAAALKENGKTAKQHGAQLDLNSAKGRANAAALNTLAASTLAARDKTLALKGSQGEVNAIMGRGYTQFVTAARGMGLSRAAADALARSLGLIPPAKNVKASVDAATAIRRARELKAQLDGIHSKTVYINVRTNKGAIGSLGPGGGYTGFRWGGVTEHARDGLLRDAKVYSPQGPARYAFAEPATGGEAFIPKRGNRQRSVSVLQTAASWLGQQVVPQRQMAGPGSWRGGGDVTNYFTIYAGNRDPQAIAREVGRELAKTGDVWGRGD